MEWIYLLTSTSIFFFLVFPFLTILLSRFKQESLQTITDPKEFDFACIITAYKNVAITEHLVQSLLNQSYQNFHIYLIGDECNPADFSMQNDRLTVFFPNPALRLKAKSIIHATENFVRAHEYTVILDADNLAHPNFLKELNLYANQGYRSIQGQRTAKNLDTSYACADAIGEFYKNYTDRYTPYLLGGSAVISGSGMAVTPAGMASKLLL